MFSSGISAQNLYLDMEGNSNSETLVLNELNYLKTHADLASINTEVDSVQTSLYRLGYIEAQLSSLERTNDSTFLAHFKLGNKFESIKIHYTNSKFIHPEILSSFSTSVSDTCFVIPYQKITSTLNGLSSTLAEQGLPFSKVQLKNITIKDNSLIAELELIPDQQKRIIDAIEIKGYEQFPRSFLRYYLNIKKNQVFNLTEIKKKTEQVQSLNFANQIKPPEVLFTKDSTTLYLYLEKQKSNSFDGFLGFGTNEDTNKIQFNGYLNLNLINTLNFGEAFRLFYKSDETDQQLFEVNAALPYLFKSPVGLAMELRVFRRDSSFTTVDQSIKTTFQINPKHQVALGLTATASNNLLSAGSISNIADYNTRFLTGSYQYQNLQFNNALFQTKSSFYFEGNLGSRKNAGISQNQSRFVIDAMHIFQLNLKNSIYFKLHGETISSDTYFENELLRFGGINSIRGFQENSLLGNTYGILNTEYRFTLSPSLYVHSITDLGYFENNISDLKKKLFSYGIGLGVLTKAGLFKLNYAAAKVEDEPFKVSNSKVHISLTTVF